MPRIAHVVIMMICLTLVAVASRGRADEVTLIPAKDNTLIEPVDDLMSNGLGDGIYSGRTSFLAEFTLRRAVLQFDLANEIPPGSEINSVTLDLFLLMAGNSSATHTLHRLQADWGEGTSSHPGGIGSPATDGDATWSHTFFPDETWTSDGGDFASTPSAMLTVSSSPGVFTWGSTDEMVADVQSWVDDPDSNFGWVLLGEEGGQGNARKFGSKDHDQSQAWPRLHVDFTPPCMPPANLNCDDVVNGADLLILLSAWGKCADPDECPEDLNDDDVVNGADLLILLSDWG